MVPFDCGWQLDDSPEKIKVLRPYKGKSERMVVLGDGRAVPLLGCWRVGELIAWQELIKEGLSNELAITFFLRFRLDPAWTLAETFDLPLFDYEKLLAAILSEIRRNQPEPEEHETPKKPPPLTGDPSSGGSDEPTRQSLDLQHLDLLSVPL